MLALVLVFAAGGLHAQPWRSKVKKSEIEWPPSPWYLMRAIVSAFGSHEETKYLTLMRVCDRLASAPRFILPPLAPMHTKHVFSGSESVAPNVCLDAFVPNHENNVRAFVVWDDVTLDAKEWLLLCQLAGEVEFLVTTGDRCAVEVTNQVFGLDDGFISVDLASRAESNEHGPTVQRLGVDGNTRGRGLLLALSASAKAFDGAHSTIPNGAAWLSYVFPKDFGRDRIVAIRAARQDEFESRILRFALVGNSLAKFPPVTETLLLADTFRKAVMSIQGRRQDQRNTAIFSGKDLDGKPISGENHAYFLPRDLDGDGLLETVDVYLPRNFSHEEYRALLSVSRLYARELKLPRKSALTVTFVQEVSNYTAKCWRSETPFVLPRFEKIRGTVEKRRIVDAPEDQIRRELAHRAMQPVQVSVQRGGAACIPLASGRTAFARSYKRVRKDDGPPREAVTATITFAEPVRGPIAIGRYAHFGLGQFVPVEGNPES